MTTGGKGLVVINKANCMAIFQIVIDDPEGTLKLTLYDARDGFRIDDDEPILSIIRLTSNWPDKIMKREYFDFFIEDFDDGEEPPKGVTFKFGRAETTWLPKKTLDNPAT